jgi:NAD(P) transhydrogenase
MPDFDLVVIGSGPAGEKGAVQAAYFDKKVCLIEKEPVPGGAAANTGTLPSKTLRETALTLSGFRQRGLDGVEFALKREATVHDLLHRATRVTGGERERVLDNLERHRVQLRTGFASFVDPHTVELKKADGATERLTASVFLIATGSSPLRPPMYQFEATRIFDSDEILKVDEIPRRLAIIGGGVIGCEYASLFAALGTRVTLVDGKTTLLPFLDGELSRVLAARLRELGVELRLGTQVEATVPSHDDVTVKLKDGHTFAADLALICAGRSANVTGMNLEAVGVKLLAKGQVEVDAKYRTAVKHIYAAGDVIGFPALASTSMEQARIAMCDAFDLKYKTALAPVLPYGIYTIPEVSMAGETEESLKAAEIPYVVGYAHFRHNARGRIIGDDTGLLKLIFRARDMRLLGVHLIGEQATELVHVGLTALLTGATVDLFIQTCFNYPTLSEAYKYAAYDAMSRAQKGVGRTAE